jgi:hypothetical protein
MLTEVKNKMSRCAMTTVAVTKPVGSIITTDNSIQPGNATAADKGKFFTSL